MTIRVIGRGNSQAFNHDSDLLDEVIGFLGVHIRQDDGEDIALVTADRSAIAHDLFDLSGNLG